MTSSINLIEIVWNATIFFFLLSIVLLGILLFVRNRFNKYEESFLLGEQKCSEEIMNFLFTQEKITCLNHHKKFESICFLNALEKIVPLLEDGDKIKINKVIKEYYIDTSLITFYKSSIFTFQKLRYISLMATLKINTFKEFYENILEDKDIPFSIKEHAFFGFASLSNCVYDFVKIWYMLNEEVKHNDASLKFCEFIYKATIENNSQEDIEIFCNDYIMKKPNADASLGFISALGDKKFIFHKDTLLKMHKKYLNKYPMMHLNILRVLNKFGVESCEIINNLYLEKEILIKISLAKIGLDLCPNAINKLYIYLFDKNYHVRFNMATSIVRHNINKDRIMKLISSKAPNKLNDLYLNDILEFIEKAKEGEQI